MSHSASLLTVLDSVDPEVRAQGVELARSMGSDAIDAILSSLPLTEGGLLWRPRGLSAELLTLLVFQQSLLVKGFRSFSCAAVSA